MPFDANGNYTLPAIYKATPGQTIYSVQHNTPLEDIQAALNAVLMRDGRVAWIGNQNANGYKLIGLADGADDQDAATVAQVSASQKACLLLASTSLQTVASDVTFTGEVTVPSVTDFTAENALGAKTADARYIQSIADVTNNLKRIISLLENADGRAVFNDGADSQVLALLADLPFSDTTQKMQAFQVVTPGVSAGQLRITFPRAFKPGTVPTVVMFGNMEGGGGGYARTYCINNITGATNTPDVNNESVGVDQTYLVNGSIGWSGNPGTIHVMAVGVFA